MTQSLSERVIELHEQGFRNTEICEILKLTRSQVAGKIWRYNNPGQWKKGVANSPKKERYK